MSGDWVDFDTHYYEADDCFTRHLAPDFAGRAVHVRRDSGRGRPFFGDDPCYYLDRIPTDLVGRPGIYAGDRDDRYRALGAQDTVVPGQVPAFVGPQARLEWMDAHGLRAAVLWPSFGLTVEHQMRDDAAACVANLRSFNRWIEQTWGFARQDRLFAVPWLSLVDLPAALHELDWALDRGARIVHLLYAPVYGRSLADPYFDPFWARLDEAGVPVGFHSGESGLNEVLSTHWGEPARPNYAQQSAFQRGCATGDWPIMTTLASLVLHNAFGRFPGLRAVSVENGSAWVPYLLRTMDKAARAGRLGQWLGGPLTDRPSDIFREHVYVAPFDDEDLPGLVNAIGIDRVLFGSDYPHPEGLEDPRAFFARSTLDEQERRQVAQVNPSRLLGL